MAGSKLNVFHVYKDLVGQSTQFQHPASKFTVRHVLRYVPLTSTRENFDLRYNLLLFCCHYHLTTGTHCYLSELPHPHKFITIESVQDIILITNLVQGTTLLNLTIISGDKYNIPITNKIID